MFRAVVAKSRPRSLKGIGGIVSINKVDIIGSSESESVVRIFLFTFLSMLRCSFFGEHASISIAVELQSP